MSHKSERMSESELKEYEYRYYKDLKKDCFRVKISNSIYRCPFCPDKQDYRLSELSRHASRYASGSLSRGIKDKARHSALQHYIERYLDVSCRSEHVEKDQLFVWPWMGIVANIARELKNGRYVGESGTKLRDEFMLKGFHPMRVHPLWNRDGHSGFAILEFHTDWDGFMNAMNFERSFEAECCGKRDYYSSRHRGDKLYGWVARDDDYHLKSIIGDHLRRTGDLKTVSGKEAEDKRKTSKLVSGLANTLKEKNRELEQVRSEYDAVNVSLNRVMDQKEKMMKSFNDGMLKL